MYFDTANIASVFAERLNPLGCSQFVFSYTHIPWIIYKATQVFLLNTGALNATQEPSDYTSLSWCSCICFIYVVNTQPFTWTLGPYRVIMFAALSKILISTWGYRLLYATPFRSGFLASMCQHTYGQLNAGNIMSQDQYCTSLVIMGSQVKLSFTQWALHLRNMPCMIVCNIYNVPLVNAMCIIATLVSKYSSKPLHGLISGTQSVESLWSHNFIIFWNSFCYKYKFDDPYHGRWAVKACLNVWPYWIDIFQIRSACVFE